MKKTFLSILMVISVLCSCEKSDCGKCGEDDSESSGKWSTLDVDLEFGSGQTKSVTSFVDSQQYEKQVNRVQILVFDADGRLNAYRDNGSATSASISVSYGAKKVWAVVNGPDLSGIASESALQAKALTLSDNSTTASKGFVMAGFAPCTVSSGTATVAISVSRLVSRIALQKITNRLPSAYGQVTIDRVILTNVVGNQNIGGNAAATIWHNLGGRKDGASSSDQIIDGTTNHAAFPTLTFKSVGSQLTNGGSLTPATPYLFYCYPNGTRSESTGYAPSMGERKTRLVVVATVAGVRYYYPVTIDLPERNRTYTVELTIAGLGSTDPERPVIKGSISASISVQGWIAGASYEEII